MKKNLTALPVYNEVETVHEVLDQVVRYCDHVLVIDDGSTDAVSYTHLTLPTIYSV